MSHTLIQRGPKDWYCSDCHQSWQSPTKAYCPGVPVIAYKDKGGLMSKTEMDKRGYKTDRLPPPAPCVFRMTDGRNDVQYVKLYDPSLCPRKKEVKHRLVHYVDHLAWPKAWLPFLEALVAWRDDHRERETFEMRNEWDDLSFSLARQTSCLLAFTHEEIAALGETVMFTFDLMPIRTRYERRKSPDFRQCQDLIEVLLKAYHRWWWANRSPDEIETQGIEAAARTERREAEMRANNRALREGLFPLVPRVTWAEDAPPPVQLSLFEDGEG